MNRYEEAFFKAKGDAYCIYQLKLNDETARWLFMSSDYLREHDMEPAYEDYDAVYSGNLPESIDSRTRMLDELFMKFNADRPQDFTGRSLSVSDIIILKVRDAMTAHYVDTIGFAPAWGFLIGMQAAANREREKA